MAALQCYARDHRGHLRFIPCFLEEVVRFGPEACLGLYAGEREALPFSAVLAAYHHDKRRIASLARRGFLLAIDGRWCAAKRAQGLYSLSGKGLPVAALVARPWRTKRRQKTRPKGKRNGVRRVRLARQTLERMAADTADYGREHATLVRRTMRTAELAIPYEHSPRFTDRCWKRQRKTRKQWMR